MTVTEQDVDHTRTRLRELVDNWVLYRDYADWERFTGVWHEDGWMTATWFQGTAEAFAEANRRAFEQGTRILHTVGASSFNIRSSRAIGQTKMSILQRGRVEGVLVDVTCWGRFFDFFELRNGRWGLVRRQPIYERDRLDLVVPSDVLRLDADILSRFPEGYCHLAYLQTHAGHHVKPDLPGLSGPSLELLYSEGEEWLDGSTEPGRRV